MNVLSGGKSASVKRSLKSSQILAKYAVGTCFDQIDPNAVKGAKKSLLDGLGVIFAASGMSKNCRPFIEMALESHGKDESCIIGTGKKTTASMAAFANGAMAHALDFEDAHDKALVHPNAALIPAAIALSESMADINGKDFITAMVIGTDIVCRLGKALKKNPMDYGWYIPPILGAFGAAVSSGRLLKLSREQMLNAFALTLCQTTCSAELRYTPNSDMRAVRDSFAAHAGLTAAKLAHKGVKGFEQTFEGRAGLFNLYARGNYDPSVLTKDIGMRFEGARVSFKPWPTCRGTHTYIEAVLMLKKDNMIEPDHISGINIQVSRLNQMLCEPKSIKLKPMTGIDAKFSLPFVIATALCHGKVELNHFEPDALKDIKVLELAGKTEYTITPKFDGENPLKGVVAIHMNDGSVFTQKVEKAYGHPDRPISERDLESKFIECVSHAWVPLPEEKINRIIETIHRLEEAENMTVLTTCLSA